MLFNGGYYYNPYLLFTSSFLRGTDYQPFSEVEIKGLLIAVDINPQEET